MRIRILALSAVMASAFSGCGGVQALIYRIAYDKAKLAAAAQPTCYNNNQLPMTNGTGSSVNLKDEGQWVLWDAEGKQYLDVGTQNYDMGDAPAVSITQLIEGVGDKSFAGKKSSQATQGGISTSVEINYKVTFELLGGTAKGKINISSAYRCSGTGCNPSQLDCAAETDFIGRRVDAQQMQIYTPQGG